MKGQNRAIRILQGTALRSRLASSYLFAGEDGIGKKSTAIEFVKAINCKHPVETAYGPDACDACPSCKKINAGTHPDVLVLGPVSAEIGICQIVEDKRYDASSPCAKNNYEKPSVQKLLSFRPLEARIKAVIMDEAHKLHISAANAFLKTLEEPSPQSIIILVSSMPDMLPITIRSRCSRINFQPLSHDDCRAALMHAGVDPGSADVMARLSMGRPGLALAEDLLKRREEFLQTLEKLQVSGSKPTWEDRPDMERWMDDALALVRDLSVLRATGSAATLLNRDMADAIRLMDGGADAKTLETAYRTLNDVRWRLLFNLNKGITWNYVGTIMGEITSHG